MEPQRLQSSQLSQRRLRLRLWILLDYIIMCCSIMVGHHEYMRHRVCVWYYRLQRRVCESGGERIGDEVNLLLLWEGGKWSMPIAL